MGRNGKDKIASGFSVSNSPSGDKFSTLQYFHTLAMQHGMVWVAWRMPMQPNGVNHREFCRCDRAGRSGIARRRAERGGQIDGRSFRPPRRASHEAVEGEA